ncbi:MAG: hypothetical protein JXB60_08795 [Candidatus Cloacimonetes bacterium]|nr:hypothetical protein [Candidatus Cloacimonadota bacterium]
MLTFFFSLILAVSINLFAQDYSHTYINQTGSEISYETHELQHTSGETVYTCCSGNEVVTTFCNSLTTRETWVNNSETNTALKAYREENTLYLTGILSGKDFSKKFAIDDLPWYQSMSYSLTGLVSSPEPEVQFWLLRIDKPKIYKMKAMKKGIEILDSNGMIIEAQKIEVRLAGFFSQFWQSHYWFRLSDGLFVKYEGVNGPPGDPLTRIELLE